MPERARPAASAHCAIETGIAMSTNITEEHRRAFEALTSGDHDNFALFSCFCNHQPAAAIVAVNECASAEETGEPEFHIKPLFISIVDGLVLTDHDGRET